MRLAQLLLLCAVVIWGWTLVATKICLAYMTPIELPAEALLALLFLGVFGMARVGAATLVGGVLVLLGVWVARSKAGATQGS